MSTPQWQPPDPAQRHPNQGEHVNYAARQPDGSFGPFVPAPKKKRRWKILLVVIGAVVVIGALAQPSDKSGNSTIPAVNQPVASTSPAPALDTPTTAAAVDTYPTKSYSGTGDDVVDIGSFTKTGILSFKCLRCAANVVLNTNGPEGLLVNTIGAYSGTHFINLRDNSLTTRLTINSDGPWQVEISDTTHVPLGSSGTGDKAIFLPGPGSKAKITNTGDANFVVQSYGASSELLVNEIGGYSGTVPIELPAFVQVESNGSWSIAVS